MKTLSPSDFEVKEDGSKKPLEILCLKCGKTVAKDSGILPFVKYNPTTRRLTSFSLGADHKHATSCLKA